MHTVTRWRRIAGRMVRDGRDTLPRVLRWHYVAVQFLPQRDDNGRMTWVRHSHGPYDVGRNAAKRAKRAAG